MSVKIDSTSNALSERGVERNKKLEAYFRQVLAIHHKKWADSIVFDYTSLERYCASAEAIRHRLINEGLGGWPERPVGIKAKEEYLGELEPGSLYRVEVEILPDVIMPALLLVPGNAKKRPASAIICQHGFGGSPEWVMGFGTPREMNYMNSCGHRLASAGYVVLAPHIVCSPPGIDRDRVRFDRLARLAGNSLLGFEMFEISRMVDYLQTRPEVVPNRIGMYGISQGGLSTLFAAACEPRIRAAVCSCYFNNRWRKMLEGEWLAERGREESQQYGDYMSTGEDDKFNPWSAPLWPDHVLSGLICPRPFMVETGRYDPVIYWRDAVEEFKKVQEGYRKLGIEERAALSLNERGWHEIFYDDAKRFLDKWLM